MSKNIENHDSVLLLQDCIAGCKMALESMDNIREHTDDKQLRELIDKYYDEHTRLSVDCRDMLDKAGADIKEPGVFAKMAVKERRIPFEIKADPDPFYSEENMRVLRERAAAIRSGKAKLKEHELIESDE